MHKLLSILTLLMVCSTGYATELSFMVMSDMHVLDTTLFKESKSLTAAIQSEPKLIEHSAELFDSAVAIVLRRQPDLLFVTGDMTKDGEYKSHQYVRTGLQRIRKSGTQIYVIPGNHDMSNPHSYQYTGDKKKKVKNLKEKDFATFYRDFGYSTAVLKQDSSLNYMVYPSDSLAVLCINSCYANKDSVCYSSGGLTEKDLLWIEQAAAAAQATGRKVILLMHHQIQEHFTAQKLIAARYIANTSEGALPLNSVQNRLTRAGIHVVFTGHFHIQSIQAISTAYGTLYDISTGSTVSYNSPLRYGTISPDGTMHIQSENISTWNDKEMERNHVTADGYVNYLVKKLFPVMQQVKQRCPAFLLKMVNIPATEKAMNTDIKKFFSAPLTKLVNRFSAGNEQDQQPEVILAECQDAFDQYVSSICKNNSLLLAIVRPLMDYTRADISEVFRSMLYNYTDTPSNSYNDHTLCLTL